MKFTTLFENTACSDSLASGHGLSLYIETAHHHILFDMGPDDGFARNAASLGVDLERVDTAVLSHGHYDHGGGMLRFLDRNRRAKLYVNQNAFGIHRNAAGRYIGLDPMLAERGRLVKTGDEYAIAPGLTLFSCNQLPRPVPTDPGGLTEQVGEFLLPDEFLHEHYLLVEENGKRILLSGCSHKGILNILSWFRPDVLVGGFHFKDLDPEGEQLRSYGEALATFDTIFYTGHCTGQSQFDRLKTILGDRLRAISTGMTIEL